jgi:hypothetical protein
MSNRSMLASLVSLPGGPLMSYLTSMGYFVKNWGMCSSRINSCFSVTKPIKLDFCYTNSINCVFVKFTSFF